MAKRKDNTTPQKPKQGETTQAREAAFRKGLGQQPEKTAEDNQAALMTLLASRQGMQEAAQLQNPAPALATPGEAERGLPVADTRMHTRIGEEQISKGMQLLRKYKAGKASVEKRITSAQEWWKLRNWQQIQGEQGQQGTSSVKSNTGWLWNCIVGKHADAMDSFPEPLILPRAMDDKQEAEKLSKIVPVVMALNDFEQTYSDAQWQKMQEGTACYGVFWDKSKLNGLGDIAIQQISLLNLFWEPGISDIQDSRNVFYVRLEDNDALRFYYPTEGTNIFVDAMCIPKDPNRSEAVYEMAKEYINFMLSEEAAIANAEYIGYASPNTLVKYNEEYKEGLEDGYEILYGSENVNDSYDYIPYYQSFDPETQALVNSLWEQLKTESSIELWVHITSGVIVLGFLAFGTYSSVLRRRRSRHYRNRA